ncbi:MAG: diguanylate cyclase [Acidobacteriaceae bacterium]
MVRKKLCLVIAALFLSYTLPCALAHGQGFTFKHYTQAQGLRNLNVDCMLQGHDGYLWLGTDHGLFRYDGARFQEYGAEDGLSSLYILALQEDASHRLWVGASGGLFYWDRNSFHQVLLDGNPLAITQDSSLAAMKDGRMLAVSRFRLVEVRPGDGPGKWLLRQWPVKTEGPAFTPQTAINGVAVDAQQDIWLGCGKGLCEISGAGLKFWGEQQGVPRDDWATLFFARNGDLWVRSPSQVLRLRPGEVKFSNLTQGSHAKFLNDYYVSFVEDKAGNILTPLGVGVAIWTGNAWKFYGPEQGLSEYPVTSLLATRDGFLWLGIGGHGLDKWLGYGTWEQWTTAQGLQAPTVWGVLKDRAGRIWVAQDGGLSVLEPHATRLLTVTKHLGDHVEAMLGLTEDQQGNIWACSGNGVIVHVDPKTLQVTRWRPDVSSAHQIFADTKDHLWISTQQGLYEIDNAATSKTAHRVILPGNGLGDVYRVVESHDGVVWAAGESGLFYYRNGRWRQLALHDAPLKGPFSDIDVAPDGSLWVVNDYNKLAHLRLDGDTVSSLKIYGRPELSSNLIEFARMDQRGWLWIGHDDGVDVFDGANWKHYGAEDGLLWNDTDNRAFFAGPDPGVAAGPDGSVWIGTSAGLSHFLRPADKQEATPIQLRIESALYGDVNLLARPVEKAHWSGAPLRIEFSPLAYQHESDIFYRYRMQGVDAEWNETSDAEARYSPLPPGKYTFQVMAVDKAWRRQSAIQTLQFTVLPPWWQTGWFYLAIMLCMLALLRWMWNIRVRRLVQQQRKLEQVVQERTQELQKEKQELITAREALRHEATHDALTGLWNRKAILELLEVELDRAMREHSSLAVVMMDLDFFKNINDQYGHLVGDAVLKECGQRLLASVRTYDSAGRYGGEEFLVLLPNLEREMGEQRLGSLNYTLTGTPYGVDSLSMQITCSMGVAWVQHGLPIVSASQILDMADAALYRAKASGRNCILHTI